MPEGPSIVILRESVGQFEGKRILDSGGNTKEDIAWLNGHTVKRFRSWGKHFLICFKDRFIRIHFLLFGSYRINEEKNAVPRLSLRFINGFIHFYACSVKVIDEDPDEIYDWSADVMSDEWNPFSAALKLSVHPEMLICDALLHQDIFAGSGNIIKNEVLYRTRIHPESKTGKLPSVKLKAVISDVREYSFQFYQWKKEFVLKKNWLAHTKKICKRCNLPILKIYAGTTGRRTFFCSNCQKLYI